MVINLCSCSPEENMEEKISWYNVEWHVQQSLFKIFLNIIWDAMCSSHSEVALAHLSWVHLWRRVSNHILLKTSCFSHFIWFLWNWKTKLLHFVPLTWSLETICTQINSFVILANGPLQSCSRGVFLYCKAGLLLPGEGGSLKKVQKLLLPNYKSVLRSSYLSKVFSGSLNAY